MSNYNFDGQSEGDWEEKGDISWNEKDWQKYLLRHEQEILRFITLYENSKDSKNQLDDVAQAMGWDAEDWSVSDLLDDEPDLEAIKNELEKGSDVFDPYTMLRHPVFVVSKSLCTSIRTSTEEYIAKRDGLSSLQQVWSFASDLAKIEQHIVLAVQALDMGDYALAICQMKLSLSSINSTFSKVELIYNGSDLETEFIRQQTNQKLFDIREVCLRIISDCKEEIKRHWKDES